MPGDSKTEKATPKRRRDERKKGNVLMSKDAVAVATLLGSLLMVQVMAGPFMEQIRRFFQFCFASIRLIGAVPYAVFRFDRQEHPTFP